MQYTLGEVQYSDGSIRMGLCSNCSKRVSFCVIKSTDPYEYSTGKKWARAGPFRAAEWAFDAVLDVNPLVNAPLFALHSIISRLEHITYMETILAYWQMCTRLCRDP